MEPVIIAKGSEPGSFEPLTDTSFTGEQQSLAIPGTLPILPIRHLVLFPGTVLPISIGRPGSRKLLEESLPQSKIIGLFTQKNPEHDEPGPDDLASIGVAASVLKLIRQADDQVVIIVNTLERIGIRKALQTHPFIRAEIDVLPSTTPPSDDKEWQAAVQQLRESALQLIELTPNVPQQARGIVQNVEDAGLLADLIASSLNLDTEQKLNLLVELDTVKRVRAVLERVSAQLEIAQLQQKIQKDVASQFNDAQRRAYLREQVKAIQRELGEGEDGNDEQVIELRKRLEALSCRKR